MYSLGPNSARAECLCLSLGSAHFWSRTSCTRYQWCITVRQFPSPVLAGPHKLQDRSIDAQLQACVCGSESHAPLFVQFWVDWTEDKIGGCSGEGHDTMGAVFTQSIVNLWRVDA